MIQYGKVAPNLSPPLPGRILETISAKWIVWRSISDWPLAKLYQWRSQLNQQMLLNFALFKYCNIIENRLARSFTPYGHIRMARCWWSSSSSPIISSTNPSSSLEHYATRCFTSFTFGGTAFRLNRFQFISITYYVNKMMNVFHSNEGCSSHLCDCFGL